DRDDEREDVDDREGDQEAAGDRAAQTPPADRAGLAPHQTAPTRDAFSSAMGRVTSNRRRRGTRSGLRVVSRVRIVKKTMIAKRMNAIAAPTPHSLLLKDESNARKAGVRVVLDGLPFVPT